MQYWYLSFTSSNQRDVWYWYLSSTSSKRHADHGTLAWLKPPLHHQQMAHNIGLSKFWFWLCNLGSPVPGMAVNLNCLAFCSRQTIKLLYMSMQSDDIITFLDTLYQTQWRKSRPCLDVQLCLYDLIRHQIQQHINAMLNIRYHVYIKLLKLQNDCYFKLFLS